MQTYSGTPQRNTTSNAAPAKKPKKGFSLLGGGMLAKVKKKVKSK